MGRQLERYIIVYLYSTEKPTYIQQVDNGH